MSGVTVVFAPSCHVSDGNDFHCLSSNVDSVAFVGSLVASNAEREVLTSNANCYCAWAADPRPVAENAEESAVQTAETA